MSTPSTALQRLHHGLSGLLITCVVFNALLRAYRAEPLIYVVSAALLLLTLVRILCVPRVRRETVWLFPMLGFGVIAACWTAFTLQPVVAAAGAVGAFAYLIIWALQLGTGAFGDDEQFLDWHVALHVFLGTITALVSIYQYGFNPDLSGILPVRPWTDAELITAGFTKRATGLIGSPQNLGMYLGLVLACLFLWKRQWGLKLAAGAVIVTAAMLSGSAAFVAFVVLFAAGYAWNGRRVHAMALRATLLIPILVGIVLAQRIENIENTDLSALYMGNPLEDRLPVYAELLDYRNGFEAVFGHGLGTATRVTEVLLGEGRTPREWKPSESYLATTAHELGLGGLSAFLLIYLVAIHKCGLLARRVGSVHLGVLLGLLGNLFATPSFTGLTMAALAWPFILYPLFAVPEGGTRWATTRPHAGA